MLSKQVVIILITLIILFSISIFFANKYPATAPTKPSKPHTLTSTPAMTVESTAASSAVNENIILTSPKSGEKLILPFTITGKARVFENQFSYRITDGNGIVIASGSAMSDAKDVGEFGNFVIPISKLPSTLHKKGMITVFDNSPKDGSEIDSVHISVELP